MKKIIYSLSVICLMFVLLVGSTFALFTSEASVNISISSGNVDVTAVIDDESITLTSFGKEMDEYFENGGTVLYDKDTNSFNLSNITPGDMVKFNILLTNNSNVNIKYRVIWEVNGELEEALKAYCNDYEIKTLTLEWESWKVSDEKEKVLAISFEMPAYVTNEFEDKNASISFKVIAVQENGSDIYNAVIVNNVDELTEALKNGGDVYINEPLTITEALVISNDTNIYGSKNSVLTFNKSKMIISNNASVTFNNVYVDNKGSYSFNDKGLLVIDNLEERNENAIFEIKEGANVVLDNGCVIKNVVSKTNGVFVLTSTEEKRSSLTLNDVTIENCAGKSGTVICANNNSDVYIEKGAKITGNLSYDCSNHGIIKIYSGSKLYINGGEIYNNTYSGNGLIGLWNAEAEMNGGKIYNNSFIEREKTYIDSASTANSRYNLIYVHKKSLFTLNGGEIVNNTVAHSSCGVIDCVNGYEAIPNLVINGGTVKENYAKLSGNVEVVGTVYSEEHLKLNNAENIEGLIYYYETGEFLFNNMELNNEETILEVKAESSLNKVVYDGVNATLSTLLVAEKPLEIWVTNSTVNCDNGLTIKGDSINNTIVLYNTNFNLKENGKVILLENNNIPTVVYLMGEIKVNDILVTKANYKDFFGSEVTVIF